MQTIHTIIVNGESYLIDDTRKMPYPNITGKPGQILSIDENNNLVWVNMSTSTDKLEYSPIQLDVKAEDYALKLDITTDPDNFVAHITYLDQDSNQEIALPLYSRAGIKNIIKEQTTDGKVVLSLERGVESPVAPYYVYMGYPHTGGIVVGDAVSTLPKYLYYYGALSATTAITSLTSVNESVVQEAITLGTMHSETEFQTNVHNINVEEGGWLVLLLPAEYSAQLFNGIGYESFKNKYDDSNTNLLSCAGSVSVTINGATYKLYGKFSYVDESLQVRIPEVSAMSEIDKTQTHVNTNILYM